MSLKCLSTDHSSVEDIFAHLEQNLNLHLLLICSPVHKWWVVLEGFLSVGFYQVCTQCTHKVQTVPTQRAPSAQSPPMSSPGVTSQF